MKGLSSCHVSTPNYRSGWDRIFKKERRKMEIETKPIEPPYPVLEQTLYGWKASSMGVDGTGFYIKDALLSYHKKWMEKYGEKRKM
jgi:hypothetical protein